MAPTLTAAADVWAELWRRQRIMSDGLAQATANLNIRLDAEYAELYAGMTEAMMSVHMPLAVATVALNTGVQAIGQRIIDATGSGYPDIYAGIQGVHDALYNRLQAGITALA